ncbi:MAG: fumarylacetoacetate hydrolase family protein [Anaerolineae bacterium]|nr:fumarylacetoacetate hydrolase family protein [Anaerolineae bacterium]
MRLVTYFVEGDLRYGVALANGVIDLPAAQVLIESGARADGPRLPPTLGELVQMQDVGIDLAREIAGRMEDAANAGAREIPKEVYFPFDRIEWRAPLRHPSRMFSLRGNNPILLRLDNLPMPQHPFLTMRYHGKVLGHQEPMTLRAADGEIGWGAELAVVLGRGGRHISASSAEKHILGYTAINDMNGSVFRSIAPELLPRPSDAHANGNIETDKRALWYSPRDEHFAGKFYGTWSMPQPIGPWIVTADEIADPYDLVVHARESGTPCDTVTTAAMILKFPEVIEFMSSFMTLKAGDIISSGALGWHTIPGREYYPPGSNFEIEIEGIGILQNPILDQRKQPPA